MQMSYHRTYHSKHRNASVFDFRQTKTIKFFLVAVGNKAKRVPEAKGQHSSDVFFESVEGSGRSGLLGRSKGSSRSEEGGDNSELHGVSFERALLTKSETIGYSNGQRGLEQVKEDRRYRSMLNFLDRRELSFTYYISIFCQLLCICILIVYV